MNTRYRIALAGLGAFCALPVLAETLGDAISAGETHLNLRYRYEIVDQDGFSDKAHASTLRGRLNFLSGDWKDLRGFVELDAVMPLFMDDFNSGAGTSSARRNQYPVVADPDYAEVNQAYLQYSGWKDTQLRVGRQRINLDNQRFIGGVGWRQNEQTYDAVSVMHNPSDKTKLFYAYIDNVNRIFGDDVDAGDHDSSTHLLNASYKVAEAGSLSGYYYAIDNDDAATFSTNTVGVRFAGKTQASENPVAYLIEYARQSDAANNPFNYDADYFRLDASIKLGAFTPSFGYESLSGDDSTGFNALSTLPFQTPLATLHAFNGWADQFLGTPSTGLVDTWLGASGKLDAWSWKALYHVFDSEVGSIDYGKELDLSFGRKVGDNYNLLLKTALFNGDSGRADVTKFWFMLTGNF